MSEAQMSGRQPGADGPEAVPDGGRVVEAVVEGERGLPPVNRPRGLESRVTRLASAGLVGVLGAGVLAWYYHGLIERQAQARGEAQSQARLKADGDSAIPPLGRVDPPPRPMVAGAGAMPVNESGDPEPAEEEVDAADGGAQGPRAEPAAWWNARPPEPPPLPSRGPHVRAVAAMDPYDAPDAVPAIRPADVELDRRLSGPAFAAVSSATGSAAAAATPTRAGGDLAERLQPTVLSAAEARVLPTRRLLLPKGAFLDCTLETAIDSSLPGIVTCVTATDTFGADGNVVLLERGTRLIGETRGDVRRGGNRLFVLWGEARTPTGVVVELASPGTDQLGRAGVTGQVDRHFGERFGAAILISVIDGAIQAGVAAASQGGDSITVSPGTSRDILTELLRETVDIPPTISVEPGTRLQVLVARDLDFRSVYDLDLVRAADAR
jgi:type IV secretion system protein VirB10